MSRFVLFGIVDGRDEMYPLRPGLNRIGTAAGSQVELPFRGVSRCHARLTLDGEGGSIEDLASRNGTYVNGRRISCGPVGVDDRLRFGPVELVLRRAMAEEGDLAISWLSAEQHGTEERETTLLGGSLARREAAPGADRRQFPPDYVVCHSPAMGEVYRQLAAVAPSPLPVLVTGETGSGKEWIARLLHAWSDRSGGALVVLNCAALPAQLIEAQLFGIGRGVATGVEARAGKFVAAHRGTLFLDEIGEMPLELQAKLLRVLEERAVEPLGEPRREVDVRVVAATNNRLEERIAAGDFRQDLYFRLAGAVIEVPPLRRRPEDVVTLVRAFVERARRAPGHEIRGLTHGAMEQLAAAPWPGNVRQLKHEVDRLVLTHRRGQTIDSSKLTGAAVGGRAASGGPADEQVPGLRDRVATLERRLIVEALEESGGNQSAAARALGLSRNGLAIKMRRLGIGSEPA